jgi:hypothetical protein
MLPTLALLLAVPATPPADLDFATGRLDGWQGDGFRITAEGGSGPSRRLAVCSGDRGPTGRKARLYRTFVVPPDAGQIVFRAAAFRRAGCQPGPALDVLLEVAGRVVVPKQVRAADGLRPAARLLPPERGRLREYVWDVERVAGQNARIIVLDDDDRPGCHVVCGGFRVVPRVEAFAAFMHRLARDHDLPPMTRVESRHFLAIGNADDDFTDQRLRLCETLYATFFDHFRDRGLAARPPAGKLMVAVFDSQAGIEAYVGERLPPTRTGLYHRVSNRLVVYDFGQSHALTAARRRGQEASRGAPNELERRLYLDAVSRSTSDARDEVNTATIMHEAAHQLSFNGGLLERDGDVAAWLAEGLACYCEASSPGGWLGVGALNPQRAGRLAAQRRAGQPWLSLRVLVESDDWLRRASSTDAILLGYAQSWALFRMLMEERPRELRRYLALIRERATPDRRLADFVEAFGDLEKLERRYHAYIGEVVAALPRAGR